MSDLSLCTRVRSSLKNLWGGEITISNSVGHGIGKGTNCEVSEGDIREKYGVFSKNI